MDKQIHGNVFYGNEISDYGQEHGYVDYLTLKKAFNAILSNDIMNATATIGEWEHIHGTALDEDGNYHDIFQLFIIDKNGADILEHWTDEIVYYNDKLDLYVWGVTHYGTAWDYVLTNIKCTKKP